MRGLPFLQSWTPMSLTGLSFLYVFLPLSLALYYVLPHRFRPGALVFFSLCYCGLAQPQCIPPMLLSTGVDFAAIRLMERWDEHPRLRRIGPILSAVKGAVLIGCLGQLVQLRTAPLFLGTVIYSMSGLDAVLYMYRREVAYERELLPFALYCVFFPRLYAGPIQPYKEFTQQLAQIHLHSRSLSMGFGQLVKGGFKRALLGDNLVRVYAAASGFSAGEQTVLSHWVAVVSLAFAAYFVLSGFADMAQGLGMMYGIFLPRNFYYPYQSRGVGDFFERFNMSATALLRRVVVDPLGARFPGRWAELPLLLLQGALFGLWLGTSWGFLLWGVYLALFMAAERYLYPGLLRRIPRLFTRIYAFCVALSSFVLLSGDGPHEVLSTLEGMLALGELRWYNNQVLYLIVGNWLVLALALLLCTNMVSLALGWLYRQFPKAASAVMGIGNLALLVILTSSLV